VPLREPGLEPFEVMTSESQERMLAIVTPDALDDVMRICARWEVRATVIGRVTPSGRLRILAGDGTVLADVPAASLHEDAPNYDRPLRRRDRAGEIDPAPLEPEDPTAALTDMLAGARWVFEQYDHMLFLNTVAGPGGDATVLRLKHPLTGADTGRALALTADGNHRWCAVDPRAGTAQVVAEAVLNLACVGARPLALVNCLNFGNPEHPEVMWELSEAIDGMAEACRSLGVPVVGGNVSLYNESGGRDIDPTPVVGVLGLVDDLRRRPPGIGLVADGVVLLAGPEPDAPSLAGSRWAWDRGARGGRLDSLDATAHLAVAGFVRSLVAAGLALGVHDIAEGGLAVALAEAAVAGGTGARIEGVVDHAALFGESPSRAVVCVAPDDEATVRERAGRAGVPLRALGRAGGDRLVIDGLVDVAIGALTAAWRDCIPFAFDVAAAH
jgi:phosphoribosylformylglycinamidine synthase